jgi:hypothetical protein
MTFGNVRDLRGRNKSCPQAFGKNWRSPVRENFHSSSCHEMCGKTHRLPILNLLLV